MIYVTVFSPILEQTLPFGCRQHLSLPEHALSHEHWCWGLMERYVILAHWPATHGNHVFTQ